MYILATEIIFVIRILVKANSDCVSTQQKLACLYNRVHVYFAVQTESCTCVRYLSFFSNRFVRTLFPETLTLGSS